MELRPYFSNFRHVDPDMVMEAVQSFNLSLQGVEMVTFLLSYFFALNIRSPESLRLPIAIGLRPSSCAVNVRRAMCFVYRALSVKSFIFVTSS